MHDRLKILFIPYLVSFAALVAGCTFLHWILNIQFSILPVKDYFYLFVFPLIFSAAIIFFYLRPRLKILRIISKDGIKDGRDFYCFVLLVCLAVPTIIMQHYLVTSTGKLTKLHSLKEINDYKPAKYYQPENYYVHITNYIYSSKFEVHSRDRYGVKYDLDMYLYFVVPIYETPADTLSYNNLVGWLGYRFKKRVDYNKDRQAEYTDFVFTSIKELKTIDLNRFCYLEKIGKSDDDDGFQEALRTLSFYPELRTTTVFKRIHTPFEQRNGNKLPWFLGTMIAGAILWFLLIVIPKTNKKELTTLQSGQTVPRKTTLNESLLFLKPHKNWLATPVLVCVNVLIFLIMFFAGYGFFIIQTKHLLAWGACYAPLVKDGQWWRLVTSIFLHGGMVHLLFNMFFLGMAGTILEKKTGTLKFSLFYLITGVCSSIVSVIWHDGGGSVGASGAISGLFGILLTLILTKRIPKSLLGIVLICTGSSLFMGMFGNVDNAAHIGGLLSGIVIGLFLFPSMPKISPAPKKQPPRRKKKRSDNGKRF
jgi:membrane associated rhomboid family serine protease